IAHGQDRQVDQQLLKYMRALNYRMINLGHPPTLKLGGHRPVGLRMSSDKQQSRGLLIQPLATLRGAIILLGQAMDARLAALPLIEGSQKWRLVDYNQVIVFMQYKVCKPMVIDFTHIHFFLLDYRFARSYCTGHGTSTPS